MLGQSLLIIPAVAWVALTGPDDALRDPIGGISQSSAELNVRADGGAYHPGRRGFYGYPRHRHIDGGGDGDSLSGRAFNGSRDDARNHDANFGSPYYGTDYGAPYHGGGYYDGGVYYRERRD